MSKKSSQTIDLGFLRGEDARTDLSGMFAASVANESEMQQAQMIKIERLLNNPYQPRQEIHEEPVDELATVIRAQGFQGVLIARPDPQDRGSYQITAGHRRREAAKRAGLVSLPVVVRDLTDEEMVTLAITENIQREDLTPLEEGKIYLLMANEMGYTHEQIAREVGRKRGYIENRIRVARAPADVQALIQAKPDSIRAVANLIKVKDHRERAEIIEQIMAGTLTVEDLPGYIARIDDGRKTMDDDGRSENGGVAAFSRNGKRADHASATQGKPHHDEERRRTRIGSAKLAAVLRYLNAYREHTGLKANISLEEQASLARIKTLVDELYGELVEKEELRIMN